MHAAAICGARAHRPSETSALNTYCTQSLYTLVMRACSCLLWSPSSPPFQKCLTNPSKSPPPTSTRPSRSWLIISRKRSLCSWSRPQSQQRLWPQSLGSPRFEWLCGGDAEYLTCVFVCDRTNNSCKPHYLSCAKVWRIPCMRHFLLGAHVCLDVCLCYILELGTYDLKRTYGR